MKLGLKYINIGYGTLEFNPVNNGTWNKPLNFPTELADMICANDGVAPTDYKTVSLAYKFIPEGTLYCLVKRIEVRGNNRSNEALWVFVPLMMDIKAQELVNVLNQTQAMFQDKMNFKSQDDFYRAVPDIFKKDFPSLNFTVPSGNMAGLNVGFISCNQHFPLVKIINLGYQKDFSRFGLIILNQTGLTTTGATILNPASFKKLIWVRWPEQFPANIKSQDGVSITIDGKFFQHGGMELTEGLHEVKFNKPGFSPMEGVVKVTAEDAGEPLKFGPDWNKKVFMKKINPGIFHVVGENKKSPTSQVSLKSPDAYDIRGNHLSSFKISDSFFVPAEVLQNFELTIECPGYESEKMFFNLESSSQNVITLKLKAETEFLNAYFNGEKISLTLQGKGATELKNNGFQLKGTLIDPLPATTKNHKSPADNSLEGIINRSNIEIEAKKKTIRGLVLITSLFFAAAVVFLILWLTKKPQLPENYFIQPNTEQTQTINKEENQADESKVENPAENRESGNIKNEQSGKNGVSEIKNNDNFTPEKDNKPEKPEKNKDNSSAVNKNLTGD